MTEAQQKVKPGDKVGVQGHDASGDRFVIAATPLGVLTTLSEHHGSVMFWPWSSVVLPDTPKAKPGVRYRHQLYVDFAIGTAAGYLAVNMKSANCDVPFDPSVWREVPE